MENNEKWCEKNQARCYVLRVVYLEKLEMTMGRMEIEEGKLVIIFPSHLRGKQDVYIRSEKLNTTEYDEQQQRNDY